MHSFLGQSLNVPQDLPKISMFFFQGGFVMSDIGCDDSRYNPSPERKLSFAHSVFRLYNPAVLKFGEVMQRVSIKHGLVYEK